MKKALVVVDMQNDFITGSLGTPEAEAILPKVVQKIQRASEQGVCIYCTRDTHGEDYLSTQEGKHLPVPHCIQGTWGHALAEPIQAVLPRDAVIVDKPSFGSPDLVRMLTEQSFSDIELVGLCTDICVLSNAILLKAYLTETPICVDASCCAGVTLQSHENALEAMKMCQVEVH